MRLASTLTACYIIDACYICSCLSGTSKGIRVDPVFPFCSFQPRSHVYILGQVQTQIQWILITFKHFHLSHLREPWQAVSNLYLFDQLFQFLVSLNHMTHIRLVMVKLFIFKTEEYLVKLCSPYLFFSFGFSMAWLKLGLAWLWLKRRSHVEIILTSTVEGTSF